jgi:hypothetical protein
MTPVEYPDWVPWAIQCTADAHLAQFPSDLRPQLLRLATAPEMRSVWETLVAAGIADATHDLGWGLRQFFSAAWTVTATFDEAEATRIRASIMEDEEIITQAAARMREDAARLRTGAYRHNDNEASALMEQCARRLEEINDGRKHTAFYLRGRNRGRTRERSHTLDFARKVHGIFNLPDHALHVVIATAISVVFENEIETYRVRDRLKSD